MAGAQKTPPLLEELAAAEKNVAELKERVDFEIIRTRCIEMNRAFDWTDGNIRKFRELDEFLRQKQQVLFEQVKETERVMKDALAKNPGFLGGEFQIAGALKLEEPYDERLVLPDVSERQFSRMVELTNRQLLEIGCASYQPFAGGLEKDARTLIEQTAPFPEFHIPPVMYACMTLWWLCTPRTFSFQDLLALDRSLFGITVTIDNYF